MANTFLLDKIKVGSENADLVARSTDEYVTTNYRNQTDITLKSAMETIKSEIDGKSGTYENATTTKAGLMSKEDKTKLDGLRKIHFGATADSEPPAEMVEGDIFIKKI